MSDTTDINGLQIPVLSDVPDIETTFHPFAVAVDTYLTGRFTTPTARDIANPTPTAGQMCYVASTGELEVFNGSKWVGAKSRNVIKTADQTVTDSTTLVDDLLLKFSVEANSYYILTGALRYKSTGTSVNDLQVGFSAPSGCSGSWTPMGPTSSVGGATDPVYVGEVAWGSSENFGALSTELFRVPLHGVLATSGSSGFITLRFAEHNSVGGITSVTMAAYSYLTLQKVG